MDMTRKLIRRALLVQIGQPMLPLTHNLFQFGSWMGGDRDGQPFRDGRDDARRGHLRAPGRRQRLLHRHRAAHVRAVHLALQPRDAGVYKAYFCHWSHAGQQPTEEIICTWMAANLGTFHWHHQLLR